MPFGGALRSPRPGRVLRGHVRFGRAGYPPPAPMRSSLPPKLQRVCDRTAPTSQRFVHRPRTRAPEPARERVPAARVRDGGRARAGLARGARARAARRVGDARLGARGRLRRLVRHLRRARLDRARARRAAGDRRRRGRRSRSGARACRGRSGGRRCSAAASLLGMLLWRVSGIVTGDGLFHLARVRKLVELGDLHLRTVNEFVDGGLHPGYAFPLWHGFLALVAKVSGLDPTVVMEHEASLLVPLACLVAYEAGVAVFGSAAAGLSRARGVARALLLRGRARRVVRDARAAGNRVAAAARAGGVRALLPLGRLAALAGPRRARGRVRGARARAPDLRALRAAAARRLRARARRRVAPHRARARRGDRPDAARVRLAAAARARHRLARPRPGREGARARTTTATCS